MNRRRALVTGATGFIGQNLVRHLCSAGWEVHAIVRPASNRSVFTAQGVAIELHEHQGTTESMLSILYDSHPDVVFHLASLALTEHQPADIERLIQSNVLFATQLIEAMTKISVRNLISTGTFWQHYQCEDYNPVNLYAATKEAFDVLLRYYVDARALRVVNLKLYDTYGPNDPRPKLINYLRRAAEENQPLAMSPGKQMIDLVYVDDVARAYILAAERFRTEEVKDPESYAVSSGNPVTLRELVDNVEKVLGKKLPIDWGKRPYRDREVMQPWFGTALPGWEPHICLKEGLGRVFLDKRSKVNSHGLCV